MARPSKPQHEQRRHEIKFLLTAGEFARAQAEATGERSIHAFARAVTVGGRLNIRQRAGFPLQAVHQADRLGVVLRQIEDHAERQGYAVPSFDRVQAAIDAVFNYDYENRIKGPGLEDDPRPHKVKFLLTDHERRQVARAAERLGLSVNDYARLCTSGRRFYVLIGEPFPATVIEDVRQQGRALWQALSESRATGAPLPPLHDAVRILEGIFHTAYLPRLQ